MKSTLPHLGFIALAYAGFASTTAHAATDTWQGTPGSTDWATNGNWTYSTGSAIASGDSLVFTSAPREWVVLSRFQSPKGGKRSVRDSTPDRG